MRANLLSRSHRQHRRQTYIEKVSRIQTANLIGYWPLNEGSGSVADNIQGVAARDGAYTGVTLNSILGPDGVGGAPFFDGANDFVNVYSDSLRDIFDGDEGTFAWWQRVFNVGVWTDGATRIAAILSADASNGIFGFSPVNANRFDVGRDAQATQKRVNIATSSIDWNHFAITWSLSAGVNGEVKIYMNSIQQGATLTAINTFAGNIVNTRSLLGANALGPLINMWHGYLAHANVWDIPLQQADISALATV